MALTARADWKISPGNVIECQVAAGVTIYDGALVGAAATASATSQTLVTNWDQDDEDLQFLGVARIHHTSASATGDSVTGVTHGLASAPQLTTIGIDVSGVVLREVTLSAGTLTSETQIGQLVYAIDENTFTTVIGTTAANQRAQGFITKIHSSTVVDIKLFTPGEAFGSPAM